nr:MAG: hypothetical protein OI716_00825 [Candidatus Methanoperedens sp.]WAI00092.1 MAG: hypothetical protein OI720_00670 [Candidatus Methanoperedens sp.]
MLNGFPKNEIIDKKINLIAGFNKNWKNYKIYYRFAHILDY